MEIGPQYNKDDNFRKKVRLYQSTYRANILKVPFKDYGNRLTDEDAKEGLNYYSGLEVRTELRKRYPNYSSMRDADMLRSEHIPFNFFVPLKKDLSLAKEVFNSILAGRIEKVVKIAIEYAPKQKGNYLNDATSFDSYIEYEDKFGKKGGIGIEVKYTENSYKVGEREQENINNEESNYHKVTLESGLYEEAKIEKLFEDEFRQIWRNHILGESMILQKDIAHFTSILIYPSGNTHIVKVIPQYKDLLKGDKQNCFKTLTFEEFIKLLRKFSKNEEYIEWVNYLNKRYLVNNEEAI
jgi:hypothetical protein